MCYLEKEERMIVITARAAKISLDLKSWPQGRNDHCTIEVILHTDHFTIEEILQPFSQK